MNLDSAKLVIADAMARAALAFPRLERAVVAACHRKELLGTLKFGAIAVGYTRVLRGPELRVADMGEYKLWVNVAEELGIVPFFFGARCTLWLTSALLRPGDTCVDAGANMGHYAFSMASDVGPSGRVLAFEANPFFVEVLARSIALNQYESRVSLFSQALWETSNLEMTFHLSVNTANSGTSSLINHGTYLSADSQTTVKTITLDDAVSASGVSNLRLVKIDVERAEEFVLVGAASLLSEQRVDFLIVELIAGGEAQRLLLGHGYQGFRADTLREVLVPIEEVPDGTFSDFVFASPGRVDELRRVAKFSSQV